MTDGAPVVVGTGFVGLDLVLPSVGAGPADVWAGGSCSNVLVGLASFGWKAACVARIGQDRAGDLLVADLHRSGVDVSLIDRVARRRTPVVLERNPGTVQGRTSSWPTRCPACNALNPVPRPWPVFAEDAATIVEEHHPTVVYVDHATPMGAALAEAGRARSAIVVFEPQVIADRASYARIAASAHVVKRAKQWAWRVRPMHEGHAHALELLTDGERGLAWRRSDRDWVTLPAGDVADVVDTVGAGDWLTIGVLERLARRGLADLDQADDDSIADALGFGQRLSEATLAHRGARGGMSGPSPRGLGLDPAKWGQERWTVPTVADVCVRCSDLRSRSACGCRLRRRA